MGYVIGLRAFNRHLHRYAAEKRRLARSQLRGRFSSFGRVTLAMLGLKGSINATPMLRGKGLEIRHLLPLCKQLLSQSHADIPKGRELLVSLSALVRAYEIMDASGPGIMEATAASELAYNLSRCGIHARAAGVHMRPKFHLLPHVAAQIASAGNPRFFAVHEDESYNQDNVRIIATARAGQFLPRLLAKQGLAALLEAEAAEWQSGR